MDHRKQPTPQVEEQLWELANRFQADHHLRYDASPQRKIDVLRAILQDFDKIEAAYVPDQIYVHQRLNILDTALEILLDKPDAVDGSASLAVAFAIDGLARIPKRFAKNTPFGSACTSFWACAHEAIYRHHPERTEAWDAAFEEFSAAVNHARTAPRTHSEGSLKSADRHVHLFALGRTMPWMALVGVSQRST